MRDQPAQRRHGQGDASGGWAESIPRDVNKDGATTAAHPGPGIVVELDNEVVEQVLPRQPVRFAARRYFDRLIVMPVTRVFAPAVVMPDTPDRQLGPWPSMAIATPPQPPKPESAAGRRAVALTLVGLNAAAAERDWNGERAGDENAARWLGRLPADCDPFKCGGHAQK